MAVRQIEYTVKADGLSPSVKQFGGVQGDHRATEVIFNISNELYNALSEQAASGGDLIYRFDGYDGEGGMCRSDRKALPEEIEDEPIQVVYPLEEWLTRYGGIVRVVLVISLSKNDLTEMELYSFPAILQLKNLPSGDKVSGESYESMSVLAQVAKDSAETAVKAKDDAVTAKAQTEEARAALEGDTVWIFDGGDASGEVEIDLVVDGAMSDISTNPVQNKVVKKYVDSSIDNSKSAINEREHPIGSIWIGGKYDATEVDLDTGDVIHTAGEPINPADIFGGKWELIDKEFASTHEQYYRGNQTSVSGHTIVDDNYIDISNTATEAVKLGFSCHGHSVRLRLGITNPSQFADNTVKLINKIDWTKFGFTQLPMGFNNSVIAHSDNANGAIVLTIVYNTGSITSNEIIAGSLNVTPPLQVNGDNPYWTEITFLVATQHMLDSFCDKFYWRRIKPTEVTE